MDNEKSSVDTEKICVSNERQNGKNEIKIADILHCLNPDNIDNSSEISASNKGSRLQISSSDISCVNVSDSGEMLGPGSSIELNSMKAANSDEQCNDGIENQESIPDKEVNLSNCTEQSSKELLSIEDQPSLEEESNENLSKSSLCEDPSFSDMSESLANLLTAIENENCNDLENGDTIMSKSNYTSDSQANEFTIPISNEDIDNNLSHKKTTTADGNLQKHSKRRLSDGNQSDSSSVTSFKRSRMDCSDKEDSRYFRSSQNETSFQNNLDDKFLKKIKVEDGPLAEQAIEKDDWKAISIKKENGSNPLADDDQFVTAINNTILSISKSISIEVPTKSYIEQLPAYLTPFTRFKPSVIIIKLRSLPNGEKIKVKTLKFPRLVYSWIFKETFLSFVDKCINLRQKFDLFGTPYVYVNSTSSDLYPVDIGPAFPFSFPKKSNKCQNITHIKLPPPLVQLASNNPQIESTRPIKINGKERVIATVNLSEGVVDCAFKESLLSKIGHAPHATNILNVEHSWPECSFEALDDIEVDYKFPFSFSDSIKEKAFCEELDVSLPLAMFKDGHYLPSVTPTQKKKYYMARSYLLRLMATTSYYIYSASLAELEGNYENSLVLNSIVCSLRPLVISQANKLGTIIVEIRQYLLSEFSCEENGFILSLINGPITFSNNCFFGNVRNVEKSIKTRNYLLEKK